jgi:hypothetical protein
MNKFVLSLVFVCITVAGVHAQKNKTPVVIPDLPTDSITGLYSYQKVNQVPGVSKDQLYMRAFSWANKFYKNPGDVIREKDPASGKLVIKARFRISNDAGKSGVETAAGDVMYTLTMNFKEERYKFEITKINWQQVSYYPVERWKDTSSPTFKPEYAHYLKQTDEFIKGVISDFEKQIGTEPVAKTSDW